MFSHLNPCDPSSTFGIEPSLFYLMSFYILHNNLDNNMSLLRHPFI